MTKYYAELTDTYGGEANYSWVTRFSLDAKSDLGAIQKLSRNIGMNFRKDWDDGDTVRYNSKSGAMCLFLSAWDDDQHNQYSRIDGI